MGQRLSGELRRNILTDLKPRDKKNPINRQTQGFNQYLSILT